MTSTEPSWCPLHRRPFASLMVAFVVLVAPVGIRAASIEAGNVTSSLGPVFFVDDASNGGTDTDINQPATPSYIRSFSGPLTRNQGPTRISLTGFGFAAHTSATANDATSIAVTFTYLGADEAVGGGDDVSIGTATGSYNFTVGGEYVFSFDAPLTADLIVTGTRFRIQITPTNPGGNGSLKLKTGALASEPAAISAKFSVAGFISSLINPQRVNLAKFQPVIPGSVSGQRLASYVTDGVVGNDNRWQSENWAWNTARVDFPFPVEVGSAQVFTGVDDGLAVGNFSVQYLNGSTWTTIPGGAVTGNTNVERNLVFTNPVTASSFRLIGQDAPLRIRELGLYPPNGPSGFPLGTDLTLNLAYQRPTVASANSTGNFAINAVDGRTHSGSMWQTSTTGTNTLDIDLRVVTRIGSAHLYSGTTGMTPLGDFALKYWDGSAWQNISGGAVSGNTTPDLVVPFSVPVTTSRVRLEFSNPGTTSIRELCVFAANTGNVGYPLGTNIINSGAIGHAETYNDAYYVITNPSSSRFLSVPASGQPSLSQSGLSAGQGQYQILLNHSNGTYRLRNRASGKCLSGAQLSKIPGLPLTDSTYSALPHQDWILDPVGGGAFRLINQWSGLVIDTAGSSTAEGTQLVQNTSSYFPTQRWQFSYFSGYPKKGIGGTTFAMDTTPNWAYNWGRANTLPLPPNATFFPMQWGNFSWDIGSSQGPIWQEYPAWRRRSDGIHLLGFNEPDRSDQANMPLTTVINLWPRLQEMDMPLVSPAPGTAGGTGGWLDLFYAQVGSLGYRVDYTAVHNYPGPSNGASNELVNFVKDAYNSWDRPVWLTEFSFVDWGRDQSWSEEDNYNCLAEFLWRAETLPELRKYALFVFTADAQNPQPANTWQDFTPAPRSNSYDSSGNLTAFGKLYAAWDNDATVRTDKAYCIHHKGSRKRIANLTAQSNLSGRNIRVDGNLVNWTLVSAGASNRYYVVSSLDGRRLRTDGTTVSLVAPGTTGTAVEWSLTESQHGWYFLVHPASAKRLHLVYNNSNFVSTYSMAANTVTDDAVQWRFIVPLVSNTPPILATIPPQTGNEGALLSFTASATDADLPANALSYSLIGAPPGAEIQSSNGVFTWTPTESDGPGIFNFTIQVSDGNLVDDQQVLVTVSEVNVPPVLATIPPQTVNEGALFSFTASATDSDLPANALSYSLIGAPPGAEIQSSNGVFTWTPTESDGPGVFNFTVQVSDGDLVDDQQVSVTVSEVNVPPVLATIPPQTVNEGASLSFTTSATDTDLPANALSYSLVGAPPGAQIQSSSGVFTWTPTESDGPGVFNFTVQVSDGTLIDDQQVTVTVDEVNTPPVLATILPQTVNEGILLSFMASATDSDLPANALSYSLIGAPPGAEIQSSSGVFTWTPTESDGPGVFNFTVQVSDGTLIDDQQVTVTVDEVNTPPVLATILPQTVNEGILLSFTASATDSDLPANALSYSLVGAPPGAEIQSSSGVFTWTPTESDGPGIFNFTIQVSDGTLSDDQQVTVTVDEVNALPVLATIPPQTVNEGALLSFTASATDTDLPANALSYSLIGAPPGAEIQSSSGVFTWTPTESDGPGVFNFTVQVSDGNLVDDQQVSVTVSEVNVPPVLATIPPQTVNEGALLSFTASATDSDLPANALSYSLIGAPPGAQIQSSSGVFTWTPTESDGPGVFNFTVQVSDGNLVDDQQVSVTVDEVNVPPVLATILPQSVNEGVLLSFTASATDSDLPANALSYSLIGAPPGAQIQSSSGVFTWTPTESDGPGVFNFTVQVSDGILIDDQEVMVTVDAVFPSASVDSDGDGLSDLLEFAFGGESGVSGSNPFRVAGVGENTISLEFPWNWQADGLSWRIRHGHDLADISSWIEVSPGVTTIVREGNIDRVTVAPTMNHPGRGFYILEVFVE